MAANLSYLKDLDYFEQRQKAAVVPIAGAVAEDGAGKRPKRKAKAKVLPKKEPA
jgi:hypothetical protein